ncbi:MAG: hypothetical protein IIV26_02015, partial [Peptococcaceae bacterium]|nr:hypothetical protein [Peptococcaceae bacterium]
THTGPLKIIPTLYRLFKKKVTAGSNYMPAVQSVSDLIFRKTICRKQINRADYSNNSFRQFRTDYADSFTAGYVCF